jgi:hypothetical protein
MYMRANANGLLINCDYPCGVLRVATDAPLVPGWRPLFRHLASFSTHASWKKSEYVYQISDEDVRIAIEWFWYDLEFT